MKIFVNPLLLFLIIQFWVLAFLFYCTRQQGSVPHAALYLLFISLLGLTLFSLPITGYLLERSLALDLKQQIKNKPDYIFTLGSGYFRGSSVEDDVLSTENYRRVQTATALWHQYPHATVVVSGGSFEVTNRSPTRMAELMKKAVAQRGVPLSQIVMEPRSKNTREHPIEALKLPNTTPQTHIAVVTSTWHLRRARQEFNRHFTHAWYYATPMKNDPIDWKDFIPNAASLSKSTVLLIEWIGLIWYQVIACLAH